MFLQASVILLTGGSASVHTGIPPPWEQTPSPPPRGADPPGADIPGSRHPLGGADTPREQTPPPGADPPSAQHAGRYGQCAGGTHPTGMQSCDNYVANQLIFSSVTSLCVHVPAWVFLALSKMSPFMII